MKTTILHLIVRIKNRLSKFYKSEIMAAIMIISCLLGLWTDYLAQSFSTKEMPIEEFTKHLHEKQKEALDVLNNLYREEKDKSTDLSILKDDYLYIEKARKQGIEYLVYNDTLLKFWTGNDINAGGVKSFPNENEFYYRAANFHCVGERIDINNSTFIALIKVKTAYSQDDMKHDVFVNGFEMPNHVTFLSQGDVTPFVTIKGLEGNDLFKLKKVPFQSPNQIFKNFCGVCWFIFFVATTLLFCKLYRLRKTEKITQTRYALIVGTIILLFLLCAFIKQPLYIFGSTLFKSTHYKTEYADSMGIVIVYTAAISLFYYIVLRRDISSKRLEGYKATRLDFAKSFLYQVISAGLAITLFYICQHFIYHSKINLAVAFIQDIHTHSFIALCLIIAWYTLLTFVCQQLIAMSLRPFNRRNRIWIGSISIVIVLISAFTSLTQFGRFYGIAIATIFAYITYRYIFTRLPRLTHTIILAFAILNIAVGLAVDLCEERNHINMTRLSEELANGQLVQKDPFAEEYIAIVAEKVRHDAKIRTLMKSYEDKSEEAEKYIRQYYLKGYWERYSVDVQIVPIGGDLKIRTDVEGTNKRIISQKYLFKHAYKIQQYRDFYLNQDIRLPYSYFGKLLGNVNRDKEIVFILYPSKSYNITDVGTVNVKYADFASNYEDISMAKYFNNKLELWTGRYNYPPSIDALNYSKKKAYHYSKGGYNHYVTKYDDGGKVVASILAKSPSLHLILMSTAFGAFFFTVMFYYLLKFCLRKKMRASIFSRSQFWMMISIVVAFSFMIMFSTQFFLKQYAMQQRAKMTQRTFAVQAYLSQQIGYRNDLKFETADWYQVVLQNFNNVIKATLIIYDNEGKQYASSNQDMFSFGSSKDSTTTHLMLPEAKFPNLGNDGFPYEETLMGNQYYSLYMEILNSYNVRVGYVQLLDKATGLSDKSPAFNFIIILTDIFLVIIMFSLFIMWLINYQIAKPLEEVTAKIKEFNLSEENPKIKYPNAEDEIGILVTHYNMMVDKLKVAAKELANNERDAAWREMARNIAHEIKNPLTPMKLTLQMAEHKQKTDPENFPAYFQKTCDILVEQIDNLTRIATEFSDFAKISNANHEKLDLMQRIRNIIDLYSVNPEGVILQSEIPADETAFIIGDGRQLSQVFNNLVKNAIQAIPKTAIGVVRVSSMKTETDITISVSDNGVGIPAENIDKIFRPNFTTKDNGMGLGLAISRSIIENTNGKIWIESTLGEGTTFFVQLPLIKDETK